MHLRILVVDDCPAARQGMKTLLEREGFEIAGEAADGPEAVRLAQSLCPDMAVLDLSMSQGRCLDAAREIHGVSPGTRLILLTPETAEHQIVRALWGGFRGYVVKASAPQDLARAIREVSRGGIFLSPSTSRAIVEGYLRGTTCPLPSD